MNFFDFLFFVFLDDKEPINYIDLSIVSAIPVNNNNNSKKI